MYKIFSTHPWLRSFPVEKQVWVAKEAGFDGIDHIATMHELLRSKENISKLSKKYGMPVLGIHSPLPLVAVTPVVLFSKLFRYISFFPECKVYNFHLSGFMHPLFNWKGNTLKRFMNLAKDKKIAISFESNPVLPIRVASRFYPKVTYHPELFATYCVQNNLPITFDTSHIADQGHDIVQFYRSYHKTIHLIHLSDYKTNAQHLPLGEGTLPLEALFKEMKRTRYRGTVSFEIYTFPNKTSIEEKLSMLKQNLKFFKKYIS